MKNILGKMFDSSGTLIGAGDGYAESYEAGSESYYAFSYPYVKYYKHTITAVSKVYVSDAYQYSWK